jgi:hypothetical protein
MLFSCAASRGFRDLMRQSQRLSGRNRARQKPVLKRIAVDEPHDIAVIPANGFDALDVRNVGMIDRRQQLRFPVEPANVFRSDRQIRAAGSSPRGHDAAECRAP